MEHSSDLTVEAMMLDSQASDLDKEERPEVFLFFVALYFHSPFALLVFRCLLLLRLRVCVLFFWW